MTISQHEKNAVGWASLPTSKSPDLHDEPQSNDLVGKDAKRNTDKVFGGIIAHPILGGNYITTYFASESSQINAFLRQFNISPKSKPHKIVIS